MASYDLYLIVLTALVSLLVLVWFFIVAKTGRRLIVLFISTTLITSLSITLVNILLIGTALCVVILVGFVIEGYKLYIELINSVAVWCSWGFSKSILIYCLHIFYIYLKKQIG